MEKKETKQTFDELLVVVNKRAEELTLSKGFQVYPLLLNTDGFLSEEGQWVIGYFKAPSLFQKMTILENINKEKLMKGHQLLELNLLKEESMMKYFKKEDPKNEGIIIGAVYEVLEKSVVYSVNRANDLKKNG